ncbi:hypothetical protein ACOMHN_008367 [Nucella lapillus]
MVPSNLSMVPSNVPKSWCWRPASPRPITARNTAITDERPLQKQTFTTSAHGQQQNSTVKGLQEPRLTGTQQRFSTDPGYLPQHRLKVYLRMELNSDQHSDRSCKMNLPGTWKQPEVLRLEMIALGCLNWHRTRGLQQRL